MKGVIAGVVAGTAGAFAWAIIAAVTGFEIGWLAWGIGAAVGAAVAWGSKGSPSFGVIAAVISILAILGGKYISLEMVLAKEMEKADQKIGQLVESEEYLICWLTVPIVREYEQENKPISWPNGVDPKNAFKKEDYPPEIWNRAEQAWNNMNEDEKAEHKTVVEWQVNSNMKALVTEVKKEGLIKSFRVIDAIFFILAIATAYKIAAKTDESAAASAEQQVKNSS